MGNPGVRRINPPSAAPVFGMYSHVAIVEPGARTAYIAGQVSVDAQGRIVAPNDLGGQVPVVFDHLERILRDLKSGWEQIIELRTYLVGRENLDAWFRERTAVYRRIFPNGDYPPNTLVVVSALNRPELRVEISATARVP